MEPAEARHGQQSLENQKLPEGQQADNEQGSGHLPSQSDYPSRCQENLSRYGHLIRKFIKTNSRTRQRCTIKLQRKAIDLEKSSKQDLDSTVAEHVNEEYLTLHEHLQQENSESDEQLLKLRVSILHVRGHPTLADFCSNISRQTSPSAQQQQQWKFRQNIMSEHEQIVSHVLQESHQKVSAHCEVFISNMIGFVLYLEMKLSHTSLELQKIWQCMTEAQKEMTQRYPQEMWRCQQFCTYERDFIKEKLKERVYTLKATIKVRALERLKASFQLLQKHVTFQMEQLMECWKLVSEERCLVDWNLKMHTAAFYSTQTSTVPGWDSQIQQSQNTYTKLQTWIYEAQEDFNTDIMACYTGIKNRLSTLEDEVTDAFQFFCVEAKKTNPAGNTTISHANRK